MMNMSQCGFFAQLMCQENVACASFLFVFLDRACGYIKTQVLSLFGRFPGHSARESDHTMAVTRYLAIVFLVAFIVFFTIDAGLDAGDPTLLEPLVAILKTTCLLNSSVTTAQMSNPKSILL